MNKHVGKITAAVLIGLIVLAASVWLMTTPPKAEAAGLVVGENKLPLARDKATAPYAVFQAWLAGSDTGKCFDDADDTLKTGATYANCAIRAEQDAVTKVWWVQVPAALTSGGYLVIFRDGADGAEANTDADVAMVAITWNRELQNLRTVTTDVMASY